MIPMRAEDRAAWDQWWQGIGTRELTKHLAMHGMDQRFVEPVMLALREGATLLDLERLFPQLRRELGVAPDDDQDGRCAVTAAVWWDGSGYSRRRFGVGS